MASNNSRFTALAHLVRDLCQLRRGPEDMPYSPALLATLIAASIAIDIAAGSVIGAENDRVAHVLVSTTLILALAWIALAMRGLGNRFVQTASALVACSIALSLIMLPLAWLAGTPPAPPARPPPLQTLLWTAMLAVVVWNLAVNAHIVRRAIEVPLGIAFAIVVAWAVADWALAHALFDAGT
ncbi:MAG: hypothetical protein ABW186_07530 [Rhodanobacteraceae bacterium]